MVAEMKMAVVESLRNTRQLNRPVSPIQAIVSAIACQAISFFGYFWTVHIKLMFSDT
jgi:hypothetical protein